MALTFVTGVVDAVGFLGLDRVFTGNMTGNIVILGMGVAGADDLPVLGPAVALAGFTVGAFVAGWVLRGGPAGSSTSTWDLRVTILLSVGAAVLLALTVVALAVENFGTHVQVVIATAIAVVMGQQAMVARKLAVKDMTTVVVTSTLTSLAGETWVRGRSGAIVNRRFSAIVVIFLGALAGAALLQIHMAIPLGAAAAGTVVVVITGHLMLREKRSGRTEFAESSSI
ncbi:MAG TPA: YoaK family protein [Mycobacterium sp.]|nr:YoaK family protein [Mycobacterium sp.]